MDAVEDYARRWIKREVDQYPELESLSDWVRTIRSLVQGRIHKLKNCVNSRPKSVFKDQEAVKCLSSLHDKYVIVPADKASNNIVFVCKSYYFECLIKELGINSNTSSNTTYKPTSFDKDEILANHRSFMTSLNIPSSKKSEDLPYLYSYQILKSCSINISDCLKSPGTCDSSPCITTCKIKTDKNNTCKTCVMLITSPEFTSNLTGKTYYTKSFEPLDCSTKNVIYGIECTLCGLLYVGETRQTLRSRMNQHRYDAKDPKYRICIFISINRVMTAV